MYLQNLNYLKENRLDLYYKLITLEQLASLDKLDIQREYHLYNNLAVKLDKQSIYLHNQHDPWQEAAQILQNADDQLSQTEHHVLFFGVGLGYLIRKFSKAYPQVPYSIYEPSAKALHAFLSEVSLEELDVTMLRNLFIGFDQTQTYQDLKSFVYQVSVSFTILTLPAYRRAFQPLHAHVLKTMENIVDNKKQIMQINNHFEKKWVKNSLSNFQYTIQSRSIFDYQNHFRDKPVLLVAAGPSLQDEMENIRNIKENGSAYIFTVGSAINTFVEYGFVPDAAFAYDPNETTQRVFHRANRENNDAFPLVFGTTVDQNTLQQFPWLKIYVPISQDPVSSYYFDKEHTSIIVQDASSIAIITLQVLQALKCSTIILVGQNFAYRDNSYYSKGVPYAPQEGDADLPVISVTGQKVRTTKALNLMRKEMEHYIRKNPAIPVINATADGAAIEGTIFKPLAEIMNTRIEPGSVMKEWFMQPDDNELNAAFLLSRKEKMIQQYDELQRLFGGIQQTMMALKTNQQPNVFQRFDGQFKELQQNLFFRYFLQPMNRVQYEMLYSKMVTVKIETDLSIKAEIVLSLFGKFLYQCYEDYISIAPDFKEFNQIIERYLLSKGLTANEAKKE